MLDIDLIEIMGEEAYLEMLEETEDMTVIGDEYLDMDYEVYSSMMGVE